MEIDRSTAETIGQRIRKPGGRDDDHVEGAERDDLGDAEAAGDVSSRSGPEGQMPPPSSSASSVVVTSSTPTTRPVVDQLLHRLPPVPVWWKTSTS